MGSGQDQYPSNAASGFKVQADTVDRKKYVDLQQFAAVLLPLPSTVFRADGISLGNAMENSGI